MNRINNNNSSNESKEDVMEYLIQKLDARQKKVAKYKNLIKTIDSFESYFAQRKEIYILLNNLEEDLKQATFAIKALVIQNKTILNDYNKQINDNKTIFNRLNFVIGENENLKLQLMKNNQSIENDDLINQNIDQNNYIDERIDNIQQMKDNNDEEEEEDEPKIQKLEDFIPERMKNNVNNNNVNKNINNSSNYNQLSNIKNIMKDIKKNKLELKQIIEQHFREQRNINPSIDNNINDH